MSKFKVLWIDDDKDKISLEMEKVENFLLKKGFQPDIKYIKKIESKDIGPESEIGADLKARIYDIIFIDFKLKDTLGSAIIGDIRKINNIYTDIVFYSSDGEDLKNEVRRSFDKGILEYIDDVHIAILDDGDYDEKIERAINKVISSWYSPGAFRGIVLDKTCKFEAKGTSILRHCCNSVGVVNFKNNIVNLFSKKLKGRMLSTFRSCQAIDDVISLVESNSHIFNWSFKSQSIKYFIDQGHYNDIDNETLQKLDEIFKIRNDISHNKMIIENACIIVCLQSGNRSFNEASVKSVIDDINMVDLALSAV